MVTFEEARREPKLRQSYIEQVDLGEFAPYIQDVCYVSSRNVNKSDKGFVMYILGSRRAVLGIPGTKPTIYVLPCAFKRNSKVITTEDDFISVLKYHEGTHAKQNFKGTPTELGATARYIKQYGLVECIFFMNRQFYEDGLLLFSSREQEIEAYTRQLTAHSSGEAPISPTLESFVKGRFKRYLGVPQTIPLEIYAPW
nr:hypothetical protein [Nanoarchaeum sp.]